MNRIVPVAIASLAALGCLVGCGGETDTPATPAPVALPGKTPDGVRIHGAAVGEWTHDWEAAIATARAEKRPILAVFTASDWNKWHKFLDERVLSAPEWSEWASKRLVLAWINHPNDPALVPAEYRERNRTLTRQYGADAFPAVFLLNFATRQTIDRYHVSRDTSFADFVSWFNRVYSESQPGGVKAYLSAEERAELESIRAEREPLKKAYEDAVEKSNERYHELRTAKTPTDDLAAWARENDKELAALKAPVDALDRKLDVFYAKAADSILLP